MKYWVALQKTTVAAILLFQIVTIQLIRTRKNYQKKIGLLNDSPKNTNQNQKIPLQGQQKNITLKMAK